MSDKVKRSDADKARTYLDQGPKRWTLAERAILRLAAKRVLAALEGPDADLATGVALKLLSSRWRLAMARSDGPRRGPRLPVNKEADRAVAALERDVNFVAELDRLVAEYQSLAEDSGEESPASSV